MGCQLIGCCPGLRYQQLLERHEVIEIVRSCDLGRYFSLVYEAAADRKASDAIEAINFLADFRDDRAVDFAAKLHFEYVQGLLGTEQEIDLASRPARAAGLKIRSRIQHGHVG